MLQGVVGERQHPFRVHVLDLGLTRLHAGQRDRFAQGVPTGLVGPHVEPAFVQIRVLHARELPLQAGHAGPRAARDVGGGPLGLAPRVEDGPLEERPVRRFGPQGVEEREERRLERRLRDPLAAGDRAVIEGVPRAIPAGRPAAAEAAATARAAYEAAQREVGMFDAAGDRHDRVRGLGIEPRLDGVEEILADERFEIPARLGGPARRLDAGDVGALAEQVVEMAQRDRVARLPRREAERGDALPELAAPDAVGVEGKRGADGRRPVGVGDQAGPEASVGVDVADRGLPAPAAALDRRVQPRSDALRADVVVELGERREDPFHELPGRRVVDRLGHRAQHDAVAAEQVLDRVMVDAVAREPRQRVDDHRVERALAAAAMVQQPAELRPLRRPGGLAGVDEDLVDVVVVLRAVGTAGLLLGGQAEVRDLFGGRDAAVENGAHGYGGGLQ